MRLSIRMVDTPVPSVHNAGTRSLAPSSPSAGFREQSTEEIEKLDRRAPTNAATPVTPMLFAARLSVVRFWSSLHARDKSRTPSSPAQGRSVRGWYQRVMPEVRRMFLAIYTYIVFCRCIQRKSFVCHMLIMEERPQTPCSVVGA